MAAALPFLTFATTAGLGISSLLRQNKVDKKTDKAAKQSRIERVEAQKAQQSEQNKQELEERKKLGTRKRITALRGEGGGSLFAGFGGAQAQTSLG